MAESIIRSEIAWLSRRMLSPATSRYPEKNNSSRSTADRINVRLCIKLANSRTSDIGRRTSKFCPMSDVLRDLGIND